MTDSTIAAVRFGVDVTNDASCFYTFYYLHVNQTKD